MATPSGKNNPGATPTQVTSSPYPLPASAAMARGLSHKSPGMIKTPSVSGHTGPAGAAHHQTHPSVSSTHQFPTPLATATGLIEDTGVPFSSPSALLALGLGDITPSPAANEALNENDIQGLAIPSLGMSGPAPRDNEEERMKNLAKVMRLLRTRVAGRGICREGLERLGRLEGLECMWQDDNLSIAGNFVDLEIEFWHGREYVKDVVLRYATPDAAEGEVRKEATEVLKRVLLQPPVQQENGEWKDPVAFHENLKYLARMDSLSRLVNCFQALEELNESLQRIHDQEQRETPRSRWEYVCTGEVGRPFMHLRETLGLSLQYWAEQRRVLDSEPSKNEDEMDVDGSEPEGDEADRKAKYWKMAIECEEGYPSLRISKEWVDSPVFKMNGEEKSINWADPPPTLVSPMNDSGVMSDSEAPNRRFIARLDPPVHLPIHAALDVYRLLELDMPQEQKLNTYDNLVLSPNANSKQQPDPLDAAAKVLPPTDRQRKRELFCFDGTKPIRMHHKYSLHTFEQVAGRTIEDLPFSHPRQLAAIIPILRQYALLSSALRRIFPESETKKQEEPEKEEKPNSLFAFMSNKDPITSKLSAFLSGSSQEAPAQKNASDSPLNVDVSLRTPVSSAPSIMLLFSPTHDNLAENTSSSKPITIRVDINPGGRVDVAEISGLPVEADMEEMRGKFSRIFETCEDVGIFANWVLKWVQRRKEAST